MTKHFLITITSLLTFCFGFAQSSIDGIVINESGEPLVGATVVLENSTIGTITDKIGAYMLIIDQELPVSIIVSYTGYQQKTVRVINLAKQPEIILQSGKFLDDVVVTASRKAEKVVDAVASVSVLSSNELQAMANSGDVNDALRNLQGITIVKSGTQFTNVELRGSAVVNESNTLILKDYAPITAIFDKRANNALNGISSLDIAKVEVVRGPAGALYGPNVTSGVIHYISKDPFKFKGTDFLLGIGEQNMFQSGLRHAGSKGKFAYKILAGYSESTDFKLRDVDLLDNNGTPTITPTTMYPVGTDLLNPGDAKGISIANLDNKVWNANLSGTLIYKLSEKSGIAYTGTLSRYFGHYRNQTGHDIVGGQSLENQLRLTFGKLFISAYQRHTFGNVDSEGNATMLANTVYNRSLSTPSRDLNGDGMLDPVSASDAMGSSNYYDLSTQYNFDLGAKTDLIVGADFKHAAAIESPVFYGINSPGQVDTEGKPLLTNDGQPYPGNNSYTVYGGYASAKYKITEQLNVNAALRYDQFVVYKQGGLSPRVGMVYKPNSSSAIRASFSRSYAAESLNRTWLDFRLPTPPIFPNIHAVGVGQEVSYLNPVTNFPWGTVEGAENFDLQEMINALALSAGVDVDATSVTGTVGADIYNTRFSGAISPLEGGGLGNPIGGSLGSLPSSVQGKPQLRTVNQIELGYSTLLKNSWAINVDLYYNQTQNIQPAGIVALSLGAQLDLEATETAIRNALPNADPAAVDAIIAELVTAPTNPTPNPDLQTAAGYGLILSDRAQNVGYKYDVGFPTYGNIDVKYIGVDLGTKYYFSDVMTVGATVSYISKNKWTAEELGETNPNFEYYLNTPTYRYGMSVNYLPKTKFYGTLAMNGQTAFEGRQGDGRVFTGENPLRTIFDLSAGYRFGKRVKFDVGISVNNVFNAEYQYFVHMPIIKRLSMINMKVHF